MKDINATVELNQTENKQISSNVHTFVEVVVEKQEGEPIESA